MGGGFESGAVLDIHSDQGEQVAHSNPLQNTGEWRGRLFCDSYFLEMLSAVPVARP